MNCLTKKCNTVKSETFVNLMWGFVWLILGTTTLLSSIIYKAWWGILLAMACDLMAYVCYTDDEYGTESVKAYLQRKRSK